MPARSSRTALELGEERRAPAVASGPAAAAHRVGSVDVLRGFAMFWILGGDALAVALKEMSAGLIAPLNALGSAIGRQLTHVEWEGFTFYDLIFPLFLFVAGVSLVYSLTTVIEREGRGAAHRRVVVRSFILFALGILYYGGMSSGWPDIRLTGVLNRIALCYLFASLLFLNLDLRGLIAAFLTLLIGYWALMSFVPVPEIGAGSFAKGANLANWIDAQYLPGRKWEGTWDPEGLLSTLPAIATCLLGVLAGLLLKEDSLAAVDKTTWLAGAGIAMLVIGQLWSLQFPIIKSIWTSSYVLVAGGWSLLLLAMFHHAIDVRGHKNWAVAFMWIGANAIALYLANNLVSFDRLAGRFVGGDMAAFFDRQVAPGAGRCLAAMVGLGLAILLARFLHRRHVFLKV